MNSIARVLSIVLLMSGVVALGGRAKGLFFVRFENSKGCSRSIDPFVEKPTVEDELFLNYAGFSAVANGIKYGDPLLRKYIEPIIPLAVLMGHQYYLTNCQGGTLSAEECANFKWLLKSLMVYPQKKARVITEFREEFARLKEDLPEEYRDAEIVVGIKYKSPSVDEIVMPEVSVQEDQTSGGSSESSAAENTACENGE